MAELLKNPAYHARAVNEVVNTQLNSEAAKHIEDAGGGELVMRKVLNVLTSMLPRAESSRNPEIEGAGHEGA